MELRGWDCADIILFSADAYVDHPSFGAAVIGRVLEAEGFRVAIVPQPDWHGDWRDFKKLGAPRLFFGIAPGCMDSMVNKYTANRRLRARTPTRPTGGTTCALNTPPSSTPASSNGSTPTCPVILGGIEASLRRLTHYDYWQRAVPTVHPVRQRSRPAGLRHGEKAVTDISRQLQDAIARNDEALDYDGTTGAAHRHEGLPPAHHGARKRAADGGPLRLKEDIPGGIAPADILLHAHETCLKDMKAQAENFRHIEEEQQAARRPHHPTHSGGVRGGQCPLSPMTQAETDHCFDLPYTRMPHPKYWGNASPPTR